MYFAVLYPQLVLPTREILMREWDPIGIAGIPDAADEYDGYISEVIGLLQRGAGVAELAAHLDASRLTGWR